MSILEIPITFAFVQNVIFIQYLGLYPLVSSLSSVRKGLYISLGIVPVLVIVSVLAYFIRALMGGAFMFFRLFVLVGIIALLILVMYGIAQKISRKYSQKRESFFILTGMNATVIGSVLLFDTLQYNLIDTVMAALFSGAGLCLALTIIASIKTKVEIEGGYFVSAGGAHILLITGLVALAMLPIDMMLLDSFFTAGRAG